MATAHDKALNSKIDLARRVNCVRLELPVVKSWIKELASCVGSVERVFSDSHTLMLEQISQASEINRTPDEVAMLLRDDVREIHRLKLELSHVRNRSRDLTQTLIRLEQTCLDSHGEIIELIRHLE